MTRKLLLASLLSLSRAPLAAKEPPRRFHGDGLHFIDARTSAGDIRFTPGDSKDVSVSAVKVSTSLCDISMEMKRDVLVLRAQDKARIAGKSAPCRAGLEIEGPAGLGFDATAGSGSIGIAGVQGRLGLRAGSGDIRLEGTAGDITARLGSGSMEAKGLSRGVNVRSGSGGVDLQWAKAPEKANVKVASGSGDVVLTFPPGTILRTSLKPGLGDALNEFGETKGTGLSVTVRTGSGRIVIKKGPTAP